MEAAKKRRQVLRSAFTKAVNSVMAKIDSACSLEEKTLAFDVLECRMEELDAAQKEYATIIFDSTLSAEEIEQELSRDDEYFSEFLKVRAKVTIMAKPEAWHTPRMSPVGARKVLKLPCIELPKFNGHVKEWLPFWSQFRKIHEDDSLGKDDKFQYLLQATVPGSRAKEVLESFPPTAENYEKAVSSLKNRFGRDDVIVEFYVRELLGLVLQNAAKGERKSSITFLYDKLELNIRALDSLGVTSDRCAAMLYPLVESSLPEETLRVWQRSGLREVAETSCDGKTTDRLTKLLDFLRMEVENEERIGMAMTGFGIVTDSDKRKGKSGSKDVPSASALLTSRNNNNIQCIFCKKDHISEQCEMARKIDLEKRKQIIKNERACFYCLRRGHFAKKCRSNVKCDWCSKRHLLLMCPNLSQEEVVEKNVNTSEHSLAALSDSPQVYLQTLRVKLFNELREKVVRVVLDSASQRSYIRTKVANELGYTTLATQELSHALFGGIKTKIESHDIFKIRLRSLDDTYSCNFSVLNRDQICASLPSIQAASWVTRLRKEGVFLTDVGSEGGEIDILIGADVVGKLWTGKKYDLQNGLTAFETFLGWTIMGKIAGRTDHATLITTMFAQEANETELWRLDVIGITDPIECSERCAKEERAREHLLSTAELSADNRYVVKLPWVVDHAPLLHNREIAYGRLMRSIDKLKRQGLFEKYDNIFREWLSEGIIERIVDNESDENCHYLPHRPVVKSHGTTKIRPVFDASACTKGYPSLNQCLEKGPNLIELVPSCLNRFRENQIGVIADIRKAFLQIVINELDRDYLRFMWVEQDKIVVFRHCRVVFGLTCSPFLLGAILELLLSSVEKQQNSSSEEIQKTVEKLKSSFYVDNCIASVDSEMDKEMFIRESTEIMAKGGFDLRGWESTGDSTGTEVTLVLGLLWNKREDTLAINPDIVKIDIPDKITKRAILSATHMLFDPIGFTSPTSLQPKLLVKELWREKVDWDEQIEGERSHGFLEWLRDLECLKRIQIPRCLGEGSITLHAFGDASKRAYAVVVFARIENEGVVSVQLLSARSRVSPEGATSNRLELMAACIACRLMKAVVKALSRPVMKKAYWTDNSTVLAWVKRDMQWGTFVWNRVKEIREISNQDEWNFVPGELNPADLPSRGCSPTQLVESKWWLGPSWLYEQEEEWPSITQDANEDEVRSELKKTVAANMTTSSPEFKASKYFSSVTKIIRFVAWVRRFLNARRKIIDDRRKGRGQNHQGCVYSSKEERVKLKLSLHEIQSAEVVLFKFLQEEMFFSPGVDKLSSFKTTLNDNGLYVLKTKIFNRPDNFNFLCPILLDNNHDIICLLVRETHESWGHVGAQLIMSNLREKFWIISIRKVIKKVISNCVICKRQKAKHMECDQPPLPLNRVRDAAVFEVVGIDFAGPLFFKGGEKGWICIFTCAVYRAVHFELASSLSTNGFIECLRRFVARRGRPKVIYSDNGTNFTGASKAFSEADWAKIYKYSSAERIEWRFNPPSAPWWGGWWERLIGVLKTILRKILGKTCLGYEGLTTVLCSTEAIINSRPLTYVSEDTENLKPLSPSMFLQEMNEVGMPDCDMMCHSKLNKKLRYKYKILKTLRERFRIEYLSRLVLKPGKEETRVVKIGDIVLVGDDKRKRIDWPLARIVEIIPGRDGKARVFVLKSKNGMFRRPIQRIYPLEISDNEVDIRSDFCEKLNILESKSAQEKCNETPSLNANKKIVTTRSGRAIERPSRYED